MTDLRCHVPLYHSEPQAPLPFIILSISAAISEAPDVLTWAVRERVLSWMLEREGLGEWKEREVFIAQIGCWLH